MIKNGSPINLQPSSNFVLLLFYCIVGLYVSLCLMIFLCPFLHCKALRTAMYKCYINSIIIIIVIIIIIIITEWMILFLLQRKQPQKIHFTPGQWTTNSQLHSKTAMFWWIKAVRGKMTIPLHECTTLSTRSVNMKGLKLRVIISDEHGNFGHDTSFLSKRIP